MRVKVEDRPGELCEISACELAALYRRRELSPVEVMRAVWARVDHLNPTLNAFVTELRDESMAAAKVAESELLSDQHDQLGALHGIPISVKDLTPTAGVRTTYGSLHFSENVPGEDALAWARLRSEGAILIGKTTTPEFGWLGVTESPLTGVTRNPWNPRRTAGGSSGGAAVAVAAGMGPLATGSDGAGSVRIPASFCGVVGLKPSFGRIPIAGEDEIFSTTEVIGPLARTVEDVALMLGVMEGPDAGEAFSLEASSCALEPDPQAFAKGLSIAYCPNLGGAPVDSDVERVTAETARALEADLGARVDQIEIDLIDPLEHLIRFWGPATAAFLDNMAEERGVELSRSQPRLLALAERGREMKATEHWQVAIVERGEMHRQIAEVLRCYDVILTPTTPVTAFSHPGDAGGPAEVAGRAVPDPFIGFLPFVAPFNMTGHPAVSVPCGFDSEGLPVGAQFVGHHGADRTVLTLAAALQGVRPWDQVQVGGEGDA